MDLKTQIAQIGLDVFAVILPFLATMLIAWLIDRLGLEKVAKIKEQLDAKQALAEAAVLFAQQVYWELDGPARYDKAAEWLSKTAKGYGLDIDEQEMKGRIEAALKVLKSEFAEQWSKT